jgi:hypothetical protein
MKREADSPGAIAVARVVCEEWRPEKEKDMAENERFGIKVAVPLNYHLPFAEVVNHVASHGLKVEGTHPEVQAIHGSGTQEVLEKLQRIPGLVASRVQKVYPT